MVVVLDLVFESVWSEIWKSHEREYAMMFYVPLMCCDYRDFSLLLSVNPSQRYTAECGYEFTGSNDALCIHPSALELSVNAKMCDPCPIFSMVMYMVTADARIFRRFNVSFPCHAAGILHRHARPFLLYPPMPYSQASDHSVTDGLANTMLLVGTPLVVTCWRNFIYSWRSWRCHSWILCGPPPPHI